MATVVAKRHILLLDMPRMLAGLVRAAVARDETLEVVGDVTEEQAAAAIAATHADLVIVGGGSAMPPLSCRAMFDVQPHLTVLAMIGNGREGTIWELAPHRIVLGELSPDILLAAMRDVRAWSWDA